MSTNVGTLYPPRAGNSTLLAWFLALFVMFTIAVSGILIARDQGQQSEGTFVGRQVVSTPSEQTFVGGTAANTPSELFGSRGDPAAARQLSDTLGTTTTGPELSGQTIGDGLPAYIYDRHQRP